MKLPVRSSTIAPAQVPFAIIRPATLVLQPKGPLNQQTALDFQTELEAALVQVRERVIVDLLWTETIDEAGIAVLVSGIRQATRLGRQLTFNSLDAFTRQILDAEIDRQQPQEWEHWFSPEFEQFLNHRAAA